MRNFKKCELTSRVVHHEIGCGKLEAINFHLTFATSQRIVLERVSDDVDLYLDKCLDEHVSLAFNTLLKNFRLSLSIASGTNI